MIVIGPDTVLSIVFGICVVIVVVCIGVLFEMAIQKTERTVERARREWEDHT